MKTISVIFLGLFPFSAMAVGALVGGPADSPVSRVEADYLCRLDSGEESVAFAIPAKGKAPRVWLTLEEDESGLEASVESFSFSKCEYCFQVFGSYFFFGSSNRFEFMIEPATPQQKAQLLAQNSNENDDLPPGSTPPGQDDLPPGSGDPGSPQEPPPEADPAGPVLAIRYIEKPQGSERVLYDGQGICRPLPPQLP